MPLTLTAPLNSQTTPLATEQTIAFFSLMMSQGVVWGLNVTAQSTPDMTVNVSAGFGICNTNTEFKKIPFSLDNNGVLGFGSSPSAGQSRIDLVVIKITRINAQETRAEVDIVQGTASASPTAPVLVETNSLFYIVLAQVTITGGSNQITSGQIVTSGNLVNASNANLQPTINSTTFEIYPISRLTNTYLQSGRFVEKTGDSISGILQFIAGQGMLWRPVYTTAQRDAIPSPQVGYNIYNSTTGQGETYTANGWSGEGITQTQKNVLTNQIAANYY